MTFRPFVQSSLCQQCNRLAHGISGCAGKPKAQRTIATRHHTDFIQHGATPLATIAAATATSAPAAALPTAGAALAWDALLLLILVLVLLSKVGMIATAAWPPVSILGLYVQQCITYQHHEACILSSNQTANYTGKSQPLYSVCALGEHGVRYKPKCDNWKADTPDYEGGKGNGMWCTNRLVICSLTSSRRISAAFSAALRRMKCPCSSFVIAPPPGAVDAAASCCEPGGPCCRLSCATPASTGCKAKTANQITGVDSLHVAGNSAKDTCLARICV